MKRGRLRKRIDGIGLPTPPRSGLVQRRNRQIGAKSVPCLPHDKNKKGKQIRLPALKEKEL